VAFELNPLTGLEVDVHSHRLKQHRKDYPRHVGLLLPLAIEIRNVESLSTVTQVLGFLLPQVIFLWRR